MDEKVSEPRPSALPTHRSEAPARPVRGKRRLSVGFVLGLIILAGLGYAVYRLVVPEPTRPRGGSHAGTPAQSVGVATIGRGDIVVEVEALGTVTPITSVTVKTQINGQLMEVAFKEGQLVKKGDFLAQIDPRPYEVLERQYEAQLAHDTGLLAEAKVDLLRYQTLAKENSIAKQQADDQFYVVQQDQGTVQSDQAQIDAQKLNLVYCHIVAPVAGRVGLRQVDPGNYVQTTDTTGLVVLTQLQPISVVFSIPENDIPEVVDAMATNPALEADAYDQADTTKIAVGHLETLDNEIDTTTGMVKARALFSNPDLHLFPNQFVNIHLLVKTLKNAIVIPQAGVQRGAPGTFAYVVGTDNTVSVRQITLGPSQGYVTAVTKGLEVGDRTVVDGSDRLRPGAKVKVTAGKTPQPGTAAAPAPGTPAAPQPPKTPPPPRNTGTPP